MRIKIVTVLAALGVVSSPAFAKHDADASFPWVQTQSVRGSKMQRRESEHWGKHHHHGIYLEGGDHERSPVKQYD